MRPSSPLLSPTTWLSSLKTAQLQKIAHATGIRSAGPKAALISRLETELAQCEYTVPPKSKTQKQQKTQPQNLSILSIDMGIRNLAFAHLLVPGATGWTQQPSDMDELSELACQKEKDAKDMFHPSPYAKQAYVLITTLLEKYQPTHVLIERQRFRSGGGSAVQEWTLRVGVFEGMFAREGKKVKMDLVGGWLEDALADGERDVKVAVSGEGELRQWVEAYLAKWKGQKRRRGQVGVLDIGKLDDLADCLLQGVTWLDWHIMRDRILRDGVGALEID
ncbi:hypothetical protein APSETT444_000783 [Aspergillus pseudonomiae]